ncbi:MAG: primosomal protein N' [Acidobacteriota bacterium]
MSCCVEVAVPVPIHRTFTYLWERAGDPPRRGVRVQVRFGRRELVGLVMGPSTGDLDPGVRLRPVSAILDAAPILDETLLSLAEFVARYYVAPIGETLRAFLPAGLGKVTSVVVERPAEAVVVLESGARAVDITAVLSRAPRQAAALARLIDAGGRLFVADLARDGVDARVVKALERRGFVRLSRAPRPPAAAGLLGLTPADAPLALSAEQEVATADLCRAVAHRQARQFLLFGVTGSGKTEVYLRAAQAALTAGRGVLILVPEIGLTPALIGRLAQRFGSGLAVLHSRLTRRERLAHWHRIRCGEARIVLGARSAVFAPLADPGLIVVDEEQDTSYKQEERPRYHARDMALVRGQRAGCPVVLVSATPSMESYTRACRGETMGLQVLTRRVSGRALPAFDIVDLRAEFRQEGRTSLLSRRLVTALAENHDRGGQAMLLLNRRGWASFLLCRACGEPVICGECSVSMTYHRQRDRLLCHYCGRHRERPAVCPLCQEAALHEMGSGTEKVEDELAALLPRLRVLRMDADTVAGRHAHLRVLSSFAAGRADVLLGTQMIAKGHDFPGVTLVGILGGDSILNLPDFRAAEWTFQLVTQVAGRAGRGDNPGRVLLQAFRSDHYALDLARRHDFPGFVARESGFREALAYPPFVVLAAVRSRHRDAAAARKFIELAATRLREDPDTPGKLSILGPAPAPLARLRGLFRYHLLVKARSRNRLTSVLTRLRQGLTGERGASTALSVDVDPVNLL